MLPTPFLLDDADGLRARLAALGPGDGRRFQLWELLRNAARTAPADYGWFVPFVAVMTREPDDVARARELIFTYLRKLEPMSFCSGLQFHFWCFAFPHAKVALYFQWLTTVGAFSDDEIRDISRALVKYHFVNFHHGLRTKPEPECVDNQALSLCLSTAIVGHLFADGSAMARLMLRDAMRRLPGMLGDMPTSGYSGEGSAYMDCVNGPAVPLATEVLERVGGYRDVLFAPAPPGGARPVNVLRMVARSFMPGGLLLPWDNYGYQFGVRSTLAYGARRTGEALFHRVLDEEVIWTYDIGIGWAYDDLVWTLIWWPDGVRSASGDDGSGDGRRWYQPGVGAALVSTDGDRYALQHWDPSTPGMPTRSHVNPNAVLFTGYRTPISADGSPAEGAAHRFQFPDTWREVGFLAIDTESRYNYGDGCAGAHSVIVLDGLESMMAHGEYEQTASTAADLAAGWVEADVTPIYRENVPDVAEVRRRTRLHRDRVFTVADRVRAGAPHTVASRFLFRPSVAPIDGGVRVCTPEGVTLQLVEVLGDTEVTLEEVAHHPAKPDGRSVLVDFTSRGADVRRLFVALISRTIEVRQPVPSFAVVADPSSSLSFDAAVAALAVSPHRVPMGLPAYLEAELPHAQRWWYRATVPKEPGPAWLRLPVGMHEPRLFVDGDEVDLSPFATSRELIAPHVALPPSLEDAESVDVVLRVDVPRGHYDGQGDGTIAMTGGVAVGYPADEELIRSVTHEDGVVTLVTSHDEYRISVDDLVGVTA
ncbi:heparinase II/III domain-containing protein [Jiangella mangrovi]|uniref:Heparinase II/III-like C-terminal domain-containing protein n=1 Tax=Jiangella mangrovi TaxID=1524084 RepID=A0A7W9GX91_9ACTN|nr:heparinase II/III family protein [Jiangella mangrovi]MBB5791704.1 hypothetical protein [Jiangella mangrovi]